ncbi:MAG: hypothetical protein WD844_09440 [Thermoleophilaceae bacterium]
MRGRLAGTLAVAVLSAGAVAGVTLVADGGDATVPVGDAFLPGNARAGAGMLSGAPTADCTQWRRGTPVQRRNVVTQLGEHFGHESSVWKGARLEQDAAYETLDGACRAPEARRVRLYKIYARALAFQGPESLD